MKYDELSTEQKNRLIAKDVMNWQPTPCDEFELTVYDSGDTCCPNCGIYEHISSFEHGEPQPPRYSESMDAAWQVLKRMNMFQKASDLEILTSELLGTTWGDLSAFMVIDILCDWTPDLICKAALSAVGAIDENGEIVEAQP